MWRFIKWPKLAAIVCFFLPWLTVSCSEQRLVSASGWDLAAGHAAVTDPITQTVQQHVIAHNWWVVLALFLTVAGAAVTFMRRPQPVTLLATSLGAVLAILLAASHLTTDALADAAAKQHRGLDQAARTLIRIEWQPGYWATLAALIVAAVLAALAWSGRSITLTRR